MVSQSPCLRWHICVQHNTQHLLLPSLGPGMQHLVSKTEPGLFKTEQSCNLFLQPGKKEFRLYLK